MSDVVSEGAGLKTRPYDTGSASARWHRCAEPSSVQAPRDEGPSTRMIAAAMRRHSLSSRTSSFRPVRVSV
jgi:hypothetical protein